MKITLYTVMYTYFTQRVHSKQPEFAYESNASSQKVLLGSGNSRTRIQGLSLNEALDAGDQGTTYVLHSILLSKYGLER